jgi:methylated-DNA-[protein]-cysteine S-methyltransferase
VGELWVDGEVLVGHELPRTQAAEGAAGELGERFAAYFAGAADSFDDVELDLDDWTPYQRALADALRAVPYGETVTYGELAALAGSPGAARAAGTFCAGNRFPLVIPCHRVVAANGIGGFGSLGVEYKRRLLELEGAHFAPARRLSSLEARGSRIAGVSRAGNGA